MIEMYNNGKENNHIMSCPHDPVSGVGRFLYPAQSVCEVGDLTERAQSEQMSSSL